MKTAILALAALISSIGPVLAGENVSFFESLSMKARDLKKAALSGVPMPSAPAAGNKGQEYRTVRVCSYMYDYPQPVVPAIGVFAFDLDKDGKACELPFFQGQPVGGYQCDGTGNTSVPAANGAAALLFSRNTGQGAQLYHQLNVPADFAGLDKFRGKMRISGKPPADLSKPLQSGGEVYSLSCKKESVPFPAE